MKKKSFIHLCLLSLLLAMVALFPACKKSNDSGGAPMIMGVRSYVASPNDTVLHSAIANGQWVVITGQNLQNATNISFDGVPASFNPALLASGSAVVQIPAIMFATVDTTKLYTITYQTPTGTATFSFKLGPAAPTISAISNVFANPGDSVYLYGTNLVLVQGFIYGGTAIKSFNSNATGTSLGFLMPAATPTSLVKVTTKSGTAIDTINATPTITWINNEDAAPGDSVYIKGTYFQPSQVLVFGGTTITAFKVSKDFKTIAFVMPAITGPQNGGPVSVTTKFGSASTVYNVEDFVDGVFQNWDNVNGYPWGLSNVVNNDPLFPGNTGYFGELFDTAVGSGDFSWWGGGRGVNMGGSQWVPAANISDNPANWAVKFEISVPASTPWTGGALYIAENYSFTYISRYTPWMSSTGTTTSFSTNGWVTVTLPLSGFLTSNGTGKPLPSISDLVGPSGNTGMNIWYINDGTTLVKSFALAIDNIRVVKIK